MTQIAHIPPTQNPTPNPLNIKPIFPKKLSTTLSLNYLPFNPQITTFYHKIQIINTNTHQTLTRQKSDKTPSIQNINFNRNINHNHMEALIFCILLFILAILHQIVRRIQIKNKQRNLLEALEIVAEEFDKLTTDSTRTYYKGNFVAGLCNFILHLQRHGKLSKVQKGLVLNYFSDYTIKFRKFNKLYDGFWYPRMRGLSNYESSYTPRKEILQQFIKELS